MASEAEVGRKEMYYELQSQQIDCQGREKSYINSMPLFNL